MPILKLLITLKTKSIQTNILQCILVYKSLCYDTHAHVNIKGKTRVKNDCVDEFTVVLVWRRTGQLARYRSSDVSSQKVVTEMTALFLAEANETLKFVIVFFESIKLILCLNLIWKLLQENSFNAFPTC